MYSVIIVLGCILINVHCVPQSQQKLPLAPHYVTSRSYSPSLSSQPCQRLAVGSNTCLNASPRCQALGSLVRYPSSTCPIQSIRTCPTSALQSPMCQSNVRPVCRLNSQRNFTPSCGTVPVLQQQCLPSQTSLISAPLLQPPCSSSITNLVSAPYMPPCLSQASTYSTVPMLPPPCFTSVPAFRSLPLLCGGFGPNRNLAPMPFSAPCLPQVTPPCLAQMPPTIMPRLDFPSLPCNRCAPVSPIPPSLTNLPYSTQFTCQERLYLPGLCDIIMPVDNMVTPPCQPCTTDCEEETPLTLPITFLPAASPVSALGISVLPPVLPPSECKCLFLRKIPIPPPCI